MGSNNSQPQQTESKPTPRRSSLNKSNKSQSNELSFSNPPLLIYLHEIYEELTFNIRGVLNRPARMISAHDLFKIAVCYPYYCQSVHDMIRQAIRTESIEVTRKQPDYSKNFQFSENMDFSRVKVIERCQFRRKLRSYLKHVNYLCIQYKEKNSDSEVTEQKEITFNILLTMFRDRWFNKNCENISNLLSNFTQITDTPADNFRQIDIILPVLSQLMGHDNCYAFIPRKNLIQKEIQEDFDELKKILISSKPRCCMNFTPTEPLHSIDINGTILTHGICSNGKFLFIVTKEKFLIAYLIYKGMIYRQIAKFNLPNNWELNERSFMFCSQKWLFIKDNVITYQLPISELICEDKIKFKITDQPNLQHIAKACSNGATYSIVGTEGPFELFDADSDKLIMKNENPKLVRSLRLMENQHPIVTNGMFIGILLDDSISMITTYLPVNPLLYQKKDCFPKDYSLPVKAATIDILSNVYFSVTYNGKNSKICSHPYTGAPDSYLFGLKLTDDLVNDSFEASLLRYLLPCAFSPAVPENLIACSNPIETDLKSIVKWIQKFDDNIHLVKALLILIDLNLRKYNYEDIARLLTPLLKGLLINRDYKRLVSALLINHFDLFFDKIGITEFSYLFTFLYHPPNCNGNVFNEWAFNKLSQSKLLSKIVLNEEIFSLFTDKWTSISREEEPFSWGVDVLLIAHQNSIEEAVEIVENDPLNLNESILISIICSNAQFLVSQFLKVIEKVIIDNKNKKDRKLDYDSILYVLISNFFASAAPITKCIQFANIITNKDAQKIIRLLNDEFESDETLQLFIGYFDMIYTASIASLIRGGSVYPCEEEFKWLIHGNFNNGNRNLTPPELCQARFFLSSLDKDVIKTASDHLPYLYQHLKRLKLRNEDTFIDPFLMAAFTHQTNTSHLLLVRNDDDKISTELNSICQWVKKMRSQFNAKKQSEKNIENNDSTSMKQKQSDKIMANIAILILLDPVLTDYLNKTPSDREQYFKLLKEFIQNNDPHQFHKVLKAIPTRIDNVLNGFDQLNSLFQTIQNQTFHRIIIDGISRVESFERLSYLLSHAELDERALNTLAMFHESCVSLLVDFHQISIVEILYTVLAACKNFKSKAIDVMNDITQYINPNPNTILYDPFFMAVAGLAASTSAIPLKISLFPPIAKACIIQLIFSNVNAPMLTVAELFSYILDIKTGILIDDPIWIKMLFTIFVKCEDDENGTINSILRNLFGVVARRLNFTKCFVFSTLPEMVYGFRSILNLGNELSISIQTLLAFITTESSIGEIFLLFAIIAGDISDCSSFHAIKNRYGKWLKYSDNVNEDYYISIPITPLSERMTFDINEVTDNIQDVELNLENGLSFDTILAFWDICMKDHGSLLCRLYLQTLIKYISTTNENIPKEYLSIIAKSAKPYINSNMLSLTQSKCYKTLSNSFNLAKKLLPEHEQGFGIIKQAEWTHLFAFNIMKLGISFINAVMLSDGFIIIQKRQPVIIQVPSGVYNGGKEPIKIENNIIQIVIFGPQSSIAINKVPFTAEPNTSIEFIVKSTDDILFETNQYNFTNSMICFENNDMNLNVEYSNSIFLGDDKMDSFTDDFESIKSVEFQIVDSQQIERTGMNILYNKLIDDHCFKEKLPFEGSASMHSILCRKNEINICNQYKSIALAQTAIKNPQLLDWQACFTLLKSSVVAVSAFDKERLKKGLFPYQLDKGFFYNCSLKIIQSSNVQIFFTVIKTFIKSEEFMNNLGKNLVIMAQDRIYHSLIHKKDLVYIMKDDLKLFKHDPNKDYIITFFDGSKGKIEIDDFGSWIVDTPIVFLLLLWIFIDNCTNSNQRICAKLALIDCMLIQSPMINKYIPEFLTYIQDNLLFMPDDFDPVYIQHLSTLAFKNKNNPQILNFYECEKNCFNSKAIYHSYISQTLDFNQIKEIDFNKSDYKLTPSKIMELILLLKNYKSVDDFPVWNFLPIWKTFSSSTYEVYTNNDSCVKEENYAIVFNPLTVPLLCAITVSKKNDQIKVYDADDSATEKNIDLQQFKDTNFGYCIVKPNEKKRFVWQNENANLDKIQMYKIIPNNQITQEALMSNIKSFAVDWKDSNTEELLQESFNINFKCNDFMFVLLKTLNMTDLIQKFGLYVVLCKLYCLFILDSYYEVFNENSTDHLSQEDDEIRRIGREYSRLFSYPNRIGNFSIQASEMHKRRILFLMTVFSQQFDSMTFDDISASNFVNGESDNYKDSMIFQLSEAVKNFSVKKFESIIWGVSFKGSSAIDMTGVTNQTISMAINSFLYQKTGLCIISPNFREKVLNTDNAEPNSKGDILVIPYPTKDDQYTENMLFTFGIVLGSMIRSGVSQEIPFPLFIWNFLAGKSITKEDVYENDILLRDQIAKMKSGELNDHHWTYKDWNNVIKPIRGFPEDMIVTQNLADIYETLVIDLRIKSLVKNLIIIRRGFWINQRIKDSAFLSGGLISFLCQGMKMIDIQEIVKRFVFEDGNKQLKNNFIKIISEYDQENIKRFLLFTTAKQRPPNFSVVPDYSITVKFKDELPVTGFPIAHTCFNTIEVPIYPTLEIMKEKLGYAILFCIEMDNK